MARREGKTVKAIRELVFEGVLHEPFSPRGVNNELGIEWARTFLPKHRVGNPGGNSELFIRETSQPAMYRLNPRDGV